MAKSRVIIANAYETERAARNARQQQVMWTRAELVILHNLYGRAVAAGQWRDYGISTTKDHAVFAMFRRAQEAADYRVEKYPAQAKKQGLYRLIDGQGRVIKRGDDLARLLARIDRRTLKLIQSTSA